jgi:DNA polymerase-3 subunit epsilon
MGLLLVADTETCGFINDNLPDDHPAQPPLVQLGLLLVDEDNGAEWATYEAIIRPNGYVIPDSASKVHGITTGVANLVGIPLSCVVPTYVHLRSRARMVVAHNAKFDLTIMRQAIARNGKPVTLQGPDAVFDTAEAATPLMKMPATARMKEYGRGGQYKTPKLTEAYRHFFGEDYNGAHSALADCRACARVFFELKRREEAARVPEDACPGHVGSLIFGKSFCERCGTHVDSLRPPDDGETDAG